MAKLQKRRSRLDAPSESKSQPSFKSKAPKEGPGTDHIVSDHSAGSNALDDSTNQVEQRPSHAAVVMPQEINQSRAAFIGPRISQDFMYPAPPQDRQSPTYTRDFAIPPREPSRTRPMSDSVPAGPSRHSKESSTSCGPSCRNCGRPKRASYWPLPEVQEGVATGSDDTQEEPRAAVSYASEPEVPTGGKHNGKKGKKSRHSMPVTGFKSPAELETPKSEDSKMEDNQIETPTQKDSVKKRRGFTAPGRRKSSFKGPTDLAPPEPKGKGQENLPPIQDVPVPTVGRWSTPAPNAASTSTADQNGESSRSRKTKSLDSPYVTALPSPHASQQPELPRFAGPSEATLVERPMIGRPPSIFEDSLALTSTHHSKWSPPPPPKEIPARKLTKKPSTISNDRVSKRKSHQRNVSLQPDLAPSEVPDGDRKHSHFVEMLSCYFSKSKGKGKENVEEKHWQMKEDVNSAPLPYKLIRTLPPQDGFSTPPRISTPGASRTASPARSESSRARSSSSRRAPLRSMPSQDILDAVALMPQLGPTPTETDKSRSKKSKTPPPRTDTVTPQTLEARKRSLDLLNATLNGSTQNTRTGPPAAVNATPRASMQSTRRTSGEAAVAPIQPQMRTLPPELAHLERARQLRTPPLDVAFPTPQPNSLAQMSRTEPAEVASVLSRPHPLSRSPSLSPPFSSISPPSNYGTPTTSTSDAPPRPPKVPLAPLQTVFDNSAKSSGEYSPSDYGSEHESPITSPDLHQLLTPSPVKKQKKPQGWVWDDDDAEGEYFKIVAEGLGEPSSVQVTPTEHEAAPAPTVSLTPRKHPMESYELDSTPAPIISLNLVIKERVSPRTEVTPVAPAINKYVPPPEKEVVPAISTNTSNNHMPPMKEITPVLAVSNSIRCRELPKWQESVSKSAVEMPSVLPQSQPTFRIPVVSTETQEKRHASPAPPMIAELDRQEEHHGSPARPVIVEFKRPEQRHTSPPPPLKEDVVRQDSQNGVNLIHRAQNQLKDRNASPSPSSSPSPKPKSKVTIIGATPTPLTPQNSAPNTPRSSAEMKRKGDPVKFAEDLAKGQTPPRPELPRLRSAISSHRHTPRPLSEIEEKEEEISPKQEAATVPTVEEEPSRGRDSLPSQKARRASKSKTRLESQTPVTPTEKERLEDQRPVTPTEKKRPALQSRYYSDELTSPNQVMQQSPTELHPPVQQHPPELQHLLQTRPYEEIAASGPEPKWVSRPIPTSKYHTSNMTKRQSKHNSKRNSVEAATPRPQTLKHNSKRNSFDTAPAIPAQPQTSKQNSRQSSMYAVPFIPAQPQLSSKQSSKSASLDVVAGPPTQPSSKPTSNRHSLDRVAPQSTTSYSPKQPHRTSKSTSHHRNSLPSPATPSMTSTTNPNPKLNRASLPAHRPTVAEQMLAERAAIATDPRHSSTSTSSSKRSSIDNSSFFHNAAPLAMNQRPKRPSISPAVAAAKAKAKEDFAGDLDWFGWGAMPGFYGSLGKELKVGEGEGERGGVESVERGRERREEERGRVQAELRQSARSPVAA